MMDNVRCIGSIALSVDGYVRLTLRDLLQLPFEGRLKWLDSQLREDLKAEHITTSRAGFCEWMSDAGAVRISLGWAWYEESSSGRLIVTPDGISSNVMLVDQNGDDYGIRISQSMLRAWLSMQS